MAQMLKLKSGAHAAGQASIENHAAMQALEAVLNRHQMRLHDLNSEMVHRRAALERQALEEAKEAAIEGA